MSIASNENGAGTGHSASNPTNRVLDVLNFLAAHPTESFTLAELARHLGQSKASAYRILTTMAEAGFLTRHPQHKTFALGIAPVAIGQAALERHRGVNIARREIAALASELKVLGCVNIVIDNDRLLLAKEGKPQSHEGLHQVGERMPLVPPIGVGYMAWSSEGDRETYISSVRADLSDAMKAHLRAAFPIIRARRYAVFASGPGMRKMRRTAILPIGRSRDSAFWSSFRQLIRELSAEEFQLLDFDKVPKDGIGYMTAPVFSPEGTVSLELEITGMPMNLSAKEIEGYAEKLSLAAAVVTNEIHGREPQ